MYLVDTRVGQPELQAWKYPMPGDEEIFMLHRVVIDVETPRVMRLKHASGSASRHAVRSHLCRGGDWSDVHWSPDGAKVAFVSSSRDHKHVQLRIADACTGDRP